MIQAGQSLAHYKIIEHLGGGGMGEVYRALDTKLDREVAIKVLPADKARDPERLKRFSREAKAIAALKHPNIVTIYSVEESDGFHFLTMELVEGKTLSEVIPNGGMPLDRFFSVAVPLADAVSSAHDKGITHRDLKPANVMQDKEGNVVVLDFGLAKLFELGLESAETVSEESDTQEGRILGTVAYMSPEQAQGGEVDHRSDVFSLGILFYQMATGRKPFEGENNISTISSILKDTPPPITELKHSLPRHLARIVRRCLAKEPDRRYQSASDLRNDLLELKEEVDSGEILLPDRPMGRRPGRRWIGIGAGVLVLAAALFGLSRLGGRSEENAALPELDSKALAVMYFENLSDAQDANRLGRIAASLLTPALSSSGQLEMVSEQRLFDILRKLKKQDVVAIDRSVASEVAQEAGVDRVILGQVSLVGSRLALSTQVVEMESGRILASQRAEGDGEESLFALVDELAHKVIEDLGPEKAQTETRAPSEAVTTQSVEAYRSYQEGLIAIRSHLFMTARSHFRKALEQDPRFAMAYFYLASPYWPPGPGWGPGSDEWQALENARRFSATASRREQGIIESVYRWKNQDDWDAAIALLDTLSQLFPRDAEFLFLAGRIRFYRQSREENLAARKIFEKALEINPDYTYVLNSLAYCYSQLQEHDRAIETIEHYVELEPENPNAHDSRGEIYFRKGDFEKAKASFQRAIEIEPLYFSYTSFSYCLAMQNRYQEALDFLRERLDDPSRESQLGRAVELASLLLVNLGREHTALEYVRKKIDEAILEGEMQREAGWNFFASDIALHLGRQEEAENWYQKGMEVSQKQHGGDEWEITEYLQRYCELRRALANGSGERARQAYERMLEIASAIDSQPFYFQTRYLLGEVLLAEEKPTEALRNFQEIADDVCSVFTPSSETDLLLINLPVEYDGLARTQVVLGQIQDAIATYEKLLDPDRSSLHFRIVAPLFHYRVGLLYEESGQSMKAVEHYRRFLDLWDEADPGHPEPADARRRLASLPSS